MEWILAAWNWMCFWRAVVAIWEGTRLPRGCSFPSRTRWLPEPLHTSTSGRHDSTSPPTIIPPTLTNVPRPLTRYVHQQATVTLYSQHALSNHSAPPHCVLVVRATSTGNDTGQDWSILADSSLNVCRVGGPAFGRRPLSQAQRVTRQPSHSPSTFGAHFEKRGGISAPQLPSSSLRTARPQPAATQPSELVFTPEVACHNLEISTSSSDHVVLTRTSVSASQRLVFCWRDLH